MRTVAVTAVILYHGSKTLAPGGFLGVDIFFVISGFVITLTLLDEHDRSGAIALGAFYRRRWWRLMPALLTATSLAVFAAVATRTQGLRSLALQAATGLTYTFNLSQAITGDRGGGVLSHLWSLGVEEQFYLIWAPTLIVALRRVPARRRLHVLAAAIGVFAVARAVTAMTLGTVVAFFTPWCRFDQLLVGAAVAVLVQRAGSTRRRRRPSPLQAVGAAAVLAGCLWIARDLTDAWLYVGGSLLVAGAAGVLVAHCASRPSTVTRMLGARPMVWLGRRSYGIYLYHYPAIVITRQLGWPAWAALAAGVLAGVGLAALSYRFVEQPLRHRGSRSHVHRGDDRGHRGVVVLDAIDPHLAEVPHELL